jgi:hypothetical protein
MERRAPSPVFFVEQRAPSPALFEARSPKLLHHLCAPQIVQVHNPKHAPFAVDDH